MGDSVEDDWDVKGEDKDNDGDIGHIVSVGLREPFSRRERSRMLTS